MKTTLEKQIADNLASTKELTLSEKWGKMFRQWLINHGGKCLTNGDVTTAKGSTVHFKTVKPHTLRVSLEVAS